MFNPTGDPTEAEKEVDRGKMFRRGRAGRMDHRYLPERCAKCGGSGIEESDVPFLRDPVRRRTRSSRVRRRCQGCDGRGFDPHWDPPTIRFYCTNSMCRGRFVIDLDVRDIVKGLLGFVRSKKVDYINYSADRECPFCHWKLRPREKHYYWRWDGKERRWVNFFNGGTIRRV